MTSDTANDLIDSANQLSARLERLSADSRWAHRASGLRGSLFRRLKHIEASLKAGTPPESDTLDQLSSLIDCGFYMLNSAAREISVPDPGKT